MSIWHQEEDMGPRATRFALVFWAALTAVGIILAIKPWAGGRDSQSRAAAPIPAREIIYQPQHWKVFLCRGARPRKPTSSPRRHRIERAGNRYPTTPPPRHP